MRLSCPQCSAENQVEIPEAFARCEFCKSTLYIDYIEIVNAKKNGSWPIYLYRRVVTHKKEGVWRDADKRQSFCTIDCGEPSGVYG